MERVAWNVFAESGRVEDYLRYKRENFLGESEHSAWEDIDGKQSSREDRMGEKAEWETPLQ